MGLLSVHPYTGVIPAGEQRALLDHQGSGQLCPVAATPQAYRLRGTSKFSPEAAPMSRSHLERDPQPQGGNINWCGHVTVWHFFTLNMVTSYLLAQQLHS